VSERRAHHDAVPEARQAGAPGAGRRSDSGSGTEPAAGLTEAFAAERARLVGLAYRMTGSRVDAEDIVQEAWLRAQRVDWTDIGNPAAWLTTVVSRLALDDLKSARRRRESYVGPWLPEPVRTPGAVGGVDAATVTGADLDADAGLAGGAGTGTTAGPVGRSPFRGRLTGMGSAGDGPGGLFGDPADAVELAETLTFGFLRLLDALEPVERVVFLLADVFDTPYREIAAVVDRSPEACRQIASRARRRVRSDRPRHDPPVDATRVAAQLLAAVSAGDVDRTVSLLAEDVELLSDGGAERRAARRPVLGSFRVARFLINVTRHDLTGPELSAEMTSLNGEPALLLRKHGRPVLTVCAEVSAGVVQAIHIVNNPTKLAALDLTTPMA
jgi:RNA polymerase sigma-70 factor (ECF subfamily)